MTSIYVHIPFCKQACSYCDFHFSTNQATRKRLIDALCKEIEWRKDEGLGVVETLYFGGGSPSILSNDELRQIFESLRKSYDLTHLQEVTIETNPDDHDAEKLAFWRSLGINRLSIGIQSFIDRDLQLMNRAHDAAHAAKCVSNARQAGFDVLTIDLIYGIPGQSFAEWQQNVQRAINLGVNHISAYCLTVEEKTALHHQVKNEKVTEKDDETIEREYLYLHQTLEQNGFEHYEISNYAKAGSRAQHNSNYWKGKAYLGFGPSAHSFDGKNQRRWNISNNISYARAIESSADYFETEDLNEDEKANERIMIGLRTRAGILWNDFDENQSMEIKANLAEMPEDLSLKLNVSTEGISIKPEYWLVSDAIIRELML